VKDINITPSRRVRRKGARRKWQRISVAFFAFLVAAMIGFIIFAMARL
jgi:hypothetical protein